MIVKNNGFEFLELLVVNEADMYGYQRLAGSYAVIQSDGKHLLCYNTLREQWELPAGHREEGETPKECAIRELYEETGQKICNLEFKALLKSKDVTTNELKYNPIYCSTLEKLQPFKSNSETSKIHLWDLKETIGYIDKVDLQLLNCIKKYKSY